MVAPVALVGLDAAGREDLPGVESDDRDVVLIGDGQDASAGVGRADPQVVQPSGPADLLGDDLQDSDAVLRDAPECRLCPDSPVAYQVSPMS